MWDWIRNHGDWMAILGVGSAAMLVISVVAVPWAVLRLPTDALRRPNPLNAFGRHHPVLRVVVFLARNVLGIVLLLAGIAMLVLPGQGILTILLALIVMEFPGKWWLEHRLVGHPAVMRLLNWIRRKGHRERLDAPVLGQRHDRAARN